MRAALKRTELRMATFRRLMLALTAEGMMLAMAEPQLTAGMMQVMIPVGMVLSMPGPMLTLETMMRDLMRMLGLHAWRLRQVLTMA
jgi:hypothetical protein